jgi:hypothetical protein
MRFLKPHHVLAEQFERLRGSVVAPEDFVGIDLGEDEGAVEGLAHLALFHRRHGGGAAPVHLVALLLRRRVDHLPAVVLGAQVTALHPHLVPHVVVPEICTFSQKRH